MNVVIQGHVANNGVHFEDDAIPVLTIGEMHVWLWNTGLPGFVEGIVEGQIEGKKDEFARMARPALINLLKQRGTIALLA